MNWNDLQQKINMIPSDKRNDDVKIFDNATGKFIPLNKLVKTIDKQTKQENIVLLINGA